MSVTRGCVLVYMAELQELLSNILCHEAVSFLIYGTVWFLLLLYIPYWIRQQLDKQFLRTVARKARERHMQQQMEKMKAMLALQEEETMLAENDMENKQREDEYETMATLKGEDERSDMPAGMEACYMQQL